MYEEGNRKLNLNWGSLAIKLVILAVVVFIVCLVITKVVGNTNGSSNSLAMGDNDYINNINTMKDAAFEYFTVSNLPEKVGGTAELTLGQMVNQKLLIDFTNDGDICDLDESYIRATKTADGNYALKVSLDCGDKSDFIVTTIEQSSCVVNGNCNNTNNDVVVDDNNNNSDNTSSGNNNNNSSSSNNNSSSSSNNSSSSGSTTTTSNKTTTTIKVTTTVKVNIKWSASGSNCGSCIIINNNNNPSTPEEPDKPSEPTEPEEPDKPTEPEEPETVRWYKHVRWSDWSDGYSNVEGAQNESTTKTTYNYCKLTNKTYYTDSYVSKTDSYPYTYNYELQILDIDPNDIVSGSIDLVSSSYFSSGLTDYQAYLDQRDRFLAMTGNTGEYDAEVSSASTMRNGALKSNNFTYRLSDIYLSGGYYRTRVTINYRNPNGVNPYYASNLGYYIYSVPVKFVVEYAKKSDCVRDTAENSSKYSGYIKTDPQTETTWRHRIPEYKWTTNRTESGWTYTGVYEDREV